MNQIHPTAILGSDVRLGDNIYIGPYCTIGPNVVLGDGIYIGPCCIIGNPPEWKGREKEDKGVVIGGGTRITGHVTIDSGADAPTFIGTACYIMKSVHIGHDALIGDNVTLSCHAIIGGHTAIQDDCNIGLGAIIHQKQFISKGCMIGMGAIVTKKLITQPFKTYVGNPARLLGDNTKHKKYDEYTIFMQDSLKIKD